jgi:hypothetical protein
MTTLFRKTAKGTEAIASRMHGPGPRLRPTLILVDGKRDLDELGRLSGMGSEAGRILEQLLQEGFVEVVPDAAPAPPRERPAARVPAPNAAETLLAAQRATARRLSALLGPQADPLCLKIESTRTWPEFVAAAARAAAVLREVRGETTAAAFMARVQEHGPPGEAGPGA